MGTSSQANFYSLRRKLLLSWTQKTGCFLPGATYLHRAQSIFRSQRAAGLHCSTDLTEGKNREDSSSFLRPQVYTVPLPNIYNKHKEEKAQKRLPGLTTPVRLHWCYFYSAASPSKHKQEKLVALHSCWHLVFSSFLFFSLVLFFDTGFLLCCHDCLKFMTISSPSTLVSSVTRTTGMCHHTQLVYF